MQDITGAWVRRQRMALDLTQEALAALAGCSVDTIRKIENGIRHPSPKLQLRLLQHLQPKMGAPESGAIIEPGSWLTQRRKQLDLTQRELGQILNYSSDAIESIENGKRLSRWIRSK